MLRARMMISFFPTVLAPFCVFTQRRHCQISPLPYFSCHFCAKKFKVSSALQSHIDQKHNIEPSSLAPSCSSTVKSLPLIESPPILEMVALWDTVAQKHYANSESMPPDDLEMGEVWEPLPPPKKFVPATLEEIKAYEIQRRETLGYDENELGRKNREDAMR